MVKTITKSANMATRRILEDNEWKEDHTIKNTHFLWILMEDLTTIFSYLALDEQLHYLHNPIQSSELVPFPSTSLCTTVAIYSLEVSCPMCIENPHKAF